MFQTLHEISKNLKKIKKIKKIKKKKETEQKKKLFYFYSIVFCLSASISAESNAILFQKKTYHWHDGPKQIAFLEH